MSESPKPPHFHSHLFFAVAELLEQCIDDGYYSDKVLDRAFRAHRQWGAKDRRFVAETVYETIRWKRKIEFALGIEQPPYLVLAFVMWMVKQNKVSPNQEMLKVWLGKIPELKSWESQIWNAYQKFESPAPDPAIEHSLPSWLYDELIRQLGIERTLSFLKASNEQAPVYLRANQLKGTVSDVIQRLKDEGIDCRGVGGDAIEVMERQNIFKSSAFAEGYFEVQDLNSQKIAPYLDLRPGQRVIDACAGAGGKTLHIAALMQNKGQLIALDIHDRKLDELRRRCQRAGTSCVTAKVIDSTKVTKRLHESADRVLLDVPCAGLGVLRRNPDTKWNVNNEELGRLNELQHEILTKYSLMTKPGGILVYSTCSILPSENELQVRRFLENSPEWSLQEEQTCYPESGGGGDGFYMARLLRLRP